MDKNLGEIYDRFMADLKERYPPSKAAQVLEVFDYLENARKQGAKVADLCYFLKQIDIDISERYLPKVMYRIRKVKGLSKTKGKKQQKESSLPAYSDNQIKKTESVSRKSSTPKKENEPYDHVKNLPVNDKYPHVYRFRKVNDIIDYFIGTPAEEYYSLGGDPDDGFEEMDIRKQKLAVTKLYNKINRQSYIYHNHTE